DPQLRTLLDSSAQLPKARPSLSTITRNHSKLFGQRGKTSPSLPIFPAVQASSSRPVSANVTTTSPTSATTRPQPPLHQEVAQTEANHARLQSIVSQGRDELAALATFWARANDA